VAVTVITGERTAKGDESRTRFGHADDVDHSAQTTEDVTLEVDPESTVYGTKLAIMELKGLVGHLVVMKWQAVLTVDGQVVFDINTMAD
jgi:hypothetical protein